MSYTTNRQPQGKVLLWTNKIREDMIAELVAIDDYAYAISQCDNSEIKEVLEHIMEDEKRHYGMFLEILRKYDVIQEDRYKEAMNHIKLSDKNTKLKCDFKKHSDCTLKFIRENIKGELEAIILYEQHICEIENDSVRKVIFDIIGDEKEHVEELTMILLKFDKDYYGPIDNQNKIKDCMDEH